MNILVLNAGSGSQKICLYRVAPDALLTGDPPAALWQAETGTDESGPDGLTNLLKSLWQGSKPVLQAPGEIDAVGHRVAHGGAEFSASVRITDEVKAVIGRLAPLAPAHNPAALAGIESVERLLGPGVPQFAVFDTAFHRTIPDAAAIYPGPYAWVAQGIRRYGFHGINHQYVAGRAARQLGQYLSSLRLISCHLGNGCSLAAIDGGRSIDTTMGFTPLEGLMMGSRSGSVDPGVLLYLMREKGLSANDLDRTLNQESGLKGISGLSGDMREIEAMSGGDANDENVQWARLALDIYIHRLRAGIGAMLACLGMVDAIIFTGGVGENSANVRKRACTGFAFAGLSLDAYQNHDHALGDRDISTPRSSVRILVIGAQEDWAIACECQRMVSIAGTRP